MQTKHNSHKLILEYKPKYPIILENVYISDNKDTGIKLFIVNKIYSYYCNEHVTSIKFEVRKDEKVLFTGHSLTEAIKYFAETVCGEIEV